MRQSEHDSDCESPKLKDQSLTWIEEEIAAEKGKSAQLVQQQEGLQQKLNQGIESISKLKESKRKAKLLQSHNSTLKTEIDLLSKESRVLKLQLNKAAELQTAIIEIDRELARMSGFSLESMNLHESEELLSQTIEAAGKIQAAVKDKVNSLLTQHLCIVCTENPREMLLFPCLHFALCSSCGVKVSRCPLCRTCVVERRSAMSVL
mmetsp:Transcript_1978/g.4410  ORF Transcript_1978/g.4410 Transcript_1978/m.4410 type:complete len:206 (-) Transcript_1978:1166-1783(-)